MGSRPPLRLPHSQEDLKPAATSTLRRIRHCLSSLPGRVRASRSCVRTPSPPPSIFRCRNSARPDHLDALARQRTANFSGRRPPGPLSGAAPPAKRPETPKTFRKPSAVPPTNTSVEPRVAGGRSVQELGAPGGGRPGTEGRASRLGVLPARRPPAIGGEGGRSRGKEVERRWSKGSGERISAVGFEIVLVLCVRLSSRHTRGSRSSRLPVSFPRISAGGRRVGR